MCELSEFTELKNDSACWFIVPDWKKEWLEEDWVKLSMEEREKIIHELDEEIVRNQMELADCQRKLEEITAKKNRILRFSIDITEKAV